MITWELIVEYYQVKEGIVFVQVVTKISAVYDAGAIARIVRTTQVLVQVQVQLVGKFLIDAEIR